MARRGHRAARVLTLILVASATILGLASPRAARAQDPRERARTQFERGVEAMRAERFQEAAEAFRASYDALPRVATMCNLALAYDRWGAYPEVAAESYERCAAEDTSGRFREHARERAVALRAELEAGTEPAPSTEPAPMPPDPFAGEPQPGGTVGGASTVTPPPGGTAPPPPETGRGHGLLWAGVGVGALSLGSLAAAIGLAVSAQSDHDYLEGKYPDGNVTDPDDQDRLDSGETKSTWSLALYITAGAAGALAAALIVLDLTNPGAAEPPPPVALTPIDGGALVTAHLTL